MSATLDPWDGEVQGRAPTTGQKVLAITGPAPCFTDRNTAAQMGVMGGRPERVRVLGGKQVRIRVLLAV